MALELPSVEMDRKSRDIPNKMIGNSRNFENQIVAEFRTRIPLTKVQKPECLLSLGAAINYNNQYASESGQLL